MYKHHFMPSDYDGDGGATYHEPSVDVDEFQLEKLIDVFERKG